MADLEKLIERLSAATGPDRELDADICAALLDAQIKRRREILQSYVFHTGDGEWSVIPAYTASLDAALALAERVLPGMLIENLGEMRDAGELTGHWLCQFGPRGPRRRMSGPITAENLRATLDAEEPVSAPTPALALCLAILKALSSTTAEGDR